MAEKWTSPRFASPTQDFDLDVLVSRLRKGFLVSVGIAAVLHLAAAGINPFKETKKKAPRPMTTKFIKREPRLTKPLELRKIPQPKRQLARREVQLARARMDQVQATASFNARSLIASHVGGSGIGLETHIGALSAVGGTNLEPKLAAVAVTRAVAMARRGIGGLSENVSSANCYGRSGGASLASRGCRKNDGREGRPPMSLAL